MDLKVIISLIGLAISIIMASIAMGTILWRLASKLAMLSGRLDVLNTKLDLHIENTEAWRQAVLGMIKQDHNDNRPISRRR